MNHPLPLRPWAVIEIAADMKSEDRCGLILAAYRASRAGVVGLVLHGVSPESVDVVLDGVVDPRDHALKGVIYLDARDEAVLPTAAGAGIVVASTARFHARLEASGIESLRPDEAGSRLAEAASARPAVCAVA